MGAPASKAASHGAPSACCANHRSSSSSAANSGDFKARASDRLWPGEASTSSKATRSSASGESCTVSASGMTCGMPSAASASATSRRGSRLRASTMTSPGLKPRCPTSSAMALATLRASITRSRSSGGRRACVKEGRHSCGGGGVAGPSGSSSRRASGRQRVSPDSALLVVWARKSCHAPLAAASMNTALTLEMTSVALRRVWSLASMAPPSPCVTKVLAAAKTRGSARRKR